MKKAILYRVIRMKDMEDSGDSLVVTLLKQAGFEMEGPITRMRRGDKFVFRQDINWRNSSEYIEMLWELKHALPVHSKKQQGLIYAS